MIGNNSFTNLQKHHIKYKGNSITHSHKLYKINCKK